MTTIEPGRTAEAVVACVVGTRPEAVKMAPVILLLRQVSGISTRVVTTGQHRQLLDQALDDFGIRPDRDLGLMRPGQSLGEATGWALEALDRAIAAEQPALVLAQGDTTTVVAAALASFYRRVPFGHVEAGLRTGQADRPFPEEKNRVVAGHLASLHFAPTPQARLNLLREGIHPATIHVTGNTAIDSLRWMTADPPEPLLVRPATDRYLLVTAHRRESFGAPLREVCEALREILDSDSDLSVVFPVHPNPTVRDAVHAALGGVPRVQLVEPLPYPGFVALMRGAFAILTDSGGVQEEGPSLGVPVLVLRDETERPEAVAAGTVQLVGPHRTKIIAAVRALTDHPETRQRFARSINPYGDGHAAARIVRLVADFLAVGPAPHLPPGVAPEWGGTWPEPAARC